MDGSLDKPPLVLRATLGWMLRMLAFLLLMIVAVAWLEDFARVHRSYRATPEITIGAVALLVLLSLWGLIQAVLQLWRRPRLELSPDGMLFSDLWWKQHWRWSEIGGFELTAVRFFDLIAIEGSRRSFVRAGGWPIKPAELIELLQQAKARWG